MWKKNVQNDIIKKTGGDYLRKIAGIFTVIVLVISFRAMGDESFSNETAIVTTTTNSAVDVSSQSAVTTSDGAVEKDDTENEVFVLEKELYNITKIKYTLDKESETEEGNATWYGGKFHGRKTTSGEVFSVNKFTAAHRQYKFGTMLKVTNIKNGKSVIVKVNDRCHAAPKRIAIDLSKGAFLEIATIHEGIVKVKIEKLKEAENE